MHPKDRPLQLILITSGGPRPGPRSIERCRENSGNLSNSSYWTPITERFSIEIIRTLPAHRRYLLE
jgi:hypothetical protein